MKKPIYLFVLMIPFILGACENDFIEPQNSFEVSKATWEDFQITAEDSYAYRATSGSWTGTSWSTEIRVQEGEVIRRSFVYETFHDVEKPANGWNESSRQEILETLNLTGNEFEEEYGEPLSDVLEWQEEGGALGNHQYTGAAEVLTLDEVYDKAENEWLPT